METTENYCYRYKSKLRPFWSGLGQVFKQYGIEDYRLSDMNDRSYVLLTTKPINTETRKELELELY